NPPQFLNVKQTNINGFANIGGGSGGVQVFPSSVVSIPNRAVWPYIQQWHLDVQKALPAKTVLVVAYVGSKGTHLTTQRDMNQLYPVPNAENPFGPAQNYSNTGPIDPNTGMPNACLPAPYRPGNIVVGTTMPLTAHAAQNL